MRRKLAATAGSVRQVFRDSRPASPAVPYVALGLAAVVVATAFATGVFAHELPLSTAGPGSFGWPALRAGRWWTVLSSFALTRNWFMAVTMPLALFVAVAPYERRAGHRRAFTVVALGHVTGSVVVALGSAGLGWSGVPFLVRAAQNLDYGGSMAVAAACGALASRLGDRRLRWAVLAFVVLGVPVHHQMADWGHLVAAPAGFLADRVRRPSSMRLGVVFAAVLTAALTWYGPMAVTAAAERIRFHEASAIPIVASPTGSIEQGRLETMAYEASALAHRPEIARVYVPPHATSGLPVVVFLHGIPGAPEDWIAGADIADLLDRGIAAHTFPRAIAVFPEFDGYHDPEAGWSNVPGQATLASVRADLLPQVAHDYRARVARGSVAVVGVGRGADGALLLARQDARVGYVVAIHPWEAPPAAEARLHALVAERQSVARYREAAAVPSSQRWELWSRALPGALSWLQRQGFGAQREAGTAT
ncbi:MAG: hypothetical protein U0V73_05105 [Acidimicrobiia bacterium]